MGLGIAALLLLVTFRWPGVATPNRNHLVRCMPTLEQNVPLTSFSVSGERLWKMYGEANCTDVS